MNECPRANDEAFLRLLTQKSSPSTRQIETAPVPSAMPATAPLLRREFFGDGAEGVGVGETRFEVAPTVREVNRTLVEVVGVYAEAIEWSAEVGRGWAGVDGGSVEDDEGSAEVGD